MSLSYQNLLFESKYASKSDSIFESINNYCAEANKLYSRYGGILSHKECLISTLTGELPEDLEHRKLVITSDASYFKAYVNSALSEVDDSKVKSSVQISLKASQSEHNLVFHYLEGLSESQKSRVRILSKMIWNNLYLKGEQDAW